MKPVVIIFSILLVVRLPNASHIQMWVCVKLQVVIVEVVCLCPDNDTCSRGQGYFHTSCRSFVFLLHFLCFLLTILFLLLLNLDLSPVSITLTAVTVLVGGSTLCFKLNPDAQLSPTASVHKYILTEHKESGSLAQQQTHNINQKGQSPNTVLHYCSPPT